MSRVHYFQRYSQPENVHTNNALLFLSRIQAHDARLLQDVLLELMKETEVEQSGLEVGVQIFQQETQAREAIPDGVLYQRSFRIVVEAKRDPASFRDSQLQGHLKEFGDESTKVLLLLAPERCGRTVEGAKERQVHVVGRTFSDLIGAAKEAGMANNRELREVLEDFEDYCDQSALLSRSEDRLMAVAAGTTFDENVSTRLYYTRAIPRFQSHGFVGLCTRRAIRAIGKVEKVIAADLIDGRVVVHGESAVATESQRARIKAAIEHAPEHGWDMQSGHAFIFVERFFETEFKKVSQGGLLGRRYLSLRAALGLDGSEVMPSPEQVAMRLREKTWS